MNIVGVEKINLRSWVLHKEVKNFANLNKDKALVRAAMIKVNIRIITDRALKYLNHHEFAKKFIAVDIFRYLN